MIAAILNSAILDSATLFFPLKLTHTCQDWFPPFAQKRLHSHVPPHHLHKKYFTHSFWLNLMMAAILNSTMLDQKTSLIHSDSTWWWQPSWILPCWIQTPCFLLPDSLKNTLPPLWLWLKLIQTDSNSYILTQLDDGSHLEFSHLEFVILDSATLVFPLKLTHTCQDWLPPFAQKKPSLIHSDSTWWWQSSWILPCWIQTLPSWIQTPSYLLSDSLKNTLPPLWLLTQTNSIWLKLIHSDSTWWWQPSWILPCWIKKTSLIHSDSTWWWQSSWILPCWIQTLPSWIQTPSYLLSDLLKNTLTPLWLWLKLIQSDSNTFILTQLAILNSTILDSAILVFPLKLTHTCQDWFPPFAQKKPSLIHSDSTWWWQPSWILSCWIQTPSYLLSN